MSRNVSISFLKSKLLFNVIKYQNVTDPTHMQKLYYCLSISHLIRFNTRSAFKIGSETIFSRFYFIWKILSGIYILHNLNLIIVTRVEAVMEFAAREYAKVHLVTVIVM